MRTGGGEEIFQSVASVGAWRRSRKSMSSKVIKSKSIHRPTRLWRVVSKHQAMNEKQPNGGEGEKENKRKSFLAWKITRENVAKDEKFSSLWWINLTLARVLCKFYTDAKRFYRLGSKCAKRFWWITQVINFSIILSWVRLAVRRKPSISSAGIDHPRQPRDWSTCTSRRKS